MESSPGGARLAGSVKPGRPEQERRGIRTSAGWARSVDNQTLLTEVPAWFKSWLQPWGGWGRRPQGDAPRSEASPWGLAGNCQLDPSHPVFVTCGIMILNHASSSVAGFAARKGEIVGLTCRLVGERPGT